MLFGLISPLLAVLFAVFGASILRLERTPARILAMFVFGYGHIILTSRVTGTLYLLSDRGAWLVVQAVLVALVLAVWGWMKQPRLGIDWPHLGWPSREEWLAAGLLAVVVVVYIVLAGLVLYVPPNNQDAMVYRLTRVMFWLQFDSFYPFEIIKSHITSYPQNHEIAMMWTILMNGTDQLTGFVQWMSATMTGVAIYGITQLIGGTRRQALMAVFLWATLPMVMLQASSTQNDHVVTAFSIIGIYGLYLGIRESNRPALLLSGLAIGMGIGTKLTIAFLLPGLALAALLIWLKEPRRLFAPMVRWAIYSIIGFLLFGLYSYAVNILAYGHILGQAENDPTTRIEIGRLQLLVNNTGAYAYQFVDFAGLPARLAIPLAEAKTDLLRQFTGSDQPFQFPLPDENRGHLIHEDYSWFGIIGFTVFLPGLVYGLVQGIRQRDPYLIGLVVMAVGFFLVHAFALLWSPYRGRYHIMMIAVAAPLTIWLLQSRHRWMVGLRWLAAGVAVLSTAVVLTRNPLKPLIGPEATAIENLDRNGLYMEWYHQHIGNLAEFDRQTPPDATIRMVERPFPFIYPFWGESLSRDILPIYGNFVSLEQAAAAQPVFLLGDPLDVTYPPSDYVLLHGRVLAALEDTSGFEQIVDLENGSYLYRRVTDE